MQTDHQTLATHPSNTDFKALAQETGPCLSVYFPTSPAPQTSFRAALQKADERLSALKLSTAERDQFLNPLRELLDTDLPQDDGTASIGIFRSLRGIWNFRLPYKVPDSVVLGNWFDVVPLVKAVSDKDQFYLLALSQKHTRLIRCTLTTSEEV